MIGVFFSYLKTHGFSPQGYPLQIQFSWIFNANTESRLNVLQRKSSFSRAQNLASAVSAEAAKSKRILIQTFCSPIIWKGLKTQDLLTNNATDKEHIELYIESEDKELQFRLF